MQRLTERADEYFHKGGIIYYPNDRGLNKAICNKLGEYEDLEEQGLMIKLPCKVGDTVWTFSYGKVISAEILKIIWSCEAENFGIYIREKIVLWGNELGQTTIDFSEIGKRYFLTKEEAEAKLREMEVGE